ncbi:MAG: pyridoxamine 5'-phosphate oxidase family protein [Cyanobacteria bacterium J06639_1]
MAPNCVSGLASKELDIYDGQNASGGTMKDPGWTRSESPFHAGEWEVQQRYGVRDRVETFGRQMVREYLLEQHRQFYARLPFLLIGAVDRRGNPWASVVASKPGFISSPDPQRLWIESHPLFGSPLQESFSVGTKVGILGILPESRRRNRLSGRISRIEATGFEVEVIQSFGNCPQYIQTRTIEVLPDIDRPSASRPLHRSDRLDDSARTLIQDADTFFIATSYAEDIEARSQGADVSHRGGKPGFVCVQNDKTFVFPDFSGNLIFNTVGNLLLNPKAGFLFIDFNSGDLLYVTGATQIIWDGGDVRDFEGAERLICCSVESIVRVEQSLPLRFTFGDYSPTLERTGSWEDAMRVKGDRDEDSSVQTNQRLAANRDERSSCGPCKST